MSAFSPTNLPPTLIPFNAVAVLNDLADLVGEQMWDVARDYRESPEGVAYRVRYSTVPIESLKEAIVDGIGRVEFDLFHPELKVVNVSVLPEGKQRIHWEPQLPELEQYELRLWNSDCNIQTDCVVFQWMRKDEPFLTPDDGKTPIIAASARSFIRAVTSESFPGFIEDKKQSWHCMRQTWRRLQIRFAGGELHWLDVDTRNAYNLTSLWDDAQTLAEAVGLDQKELPDWCNVESPTIPQIVDKVAEGLHHYANDFGVMWDVENGRATDDLAAIDAGVAVLLAGFDSRNDPDERIGQLRNRKLPTGCKFIEVHNRLANDPYLIAECAVCGHRVFPNGKNYLVGSGNVKSIYHKCTPGVVQVCIVDADPETGTVWYDNGGEKKPYPVGRRPAAYLRVLIDNPQRRRSGKDVHDQFTECHPAHATTYKNALPPVIVRVIHTNNRGSILTADAYRDESRPS